MHKVQSMMVSQGEITCLGDLSYELKNPPPTRKKHFYLEEQVTDVVIQTWFW